MNGFIERLDGELAARRVGPAMRRRIALEYADHLACDPDSEPRLGDPAKLARAFAAELAADDARATARDTFLALALAALALVVGQLTIVPAGGYPGYNGGAETALAMLAILTILIAPQIALVAGSLAALRAFRRRGARQLPDAEVALIYRRSSIARVAGLATAAALLLYVLNFTQQMAGWWLALQAGLAIVAIAALTRVTLQARRSRRPIAAVPGPSGGIVDDIPPLALIAAHRRAACVAVVLLAGVSGTVLGGVAERSLVEGLERGAFEALVVGVCLALTVRICAGRGARDPLPHC